MTKQRVEYFMNSWRWTKQEEKKFSKFIVGSCVHVCCGLSKVGEYRIDISPYGNIRGSAYKLPFKDKCIDTVISDPPWNLAFIPKYWQEIERIAKKRIIVICLSQFNYHGWDIYHQEIIKRAQGFQLKILTVYIQPNQDITTFGENSNNG